MPVVAPAVTVMLALPVPGLGPKLGSLVIVSETVVVSVSDPDVPVMVTVAGVEITAADVVAVRVSTSVSEAVPAAKLAVTPLGRPDAANATVSANPPTGATVIVLVPVPPWATETLVGEAERLKPGGSAVVTLSATVVVALSEAEVPLMVTVAGLDVTAAEELAVKVSTSVSGRVPAAKLAVTPVGRPVALYVTAALNPPAGNTVIVLVPVPPWGTETLIGEAESVKLGGALTLTATVVVSLIEAEIPLMVTVTGLDVTGAEELAVRVSTSVSATVPAAKLAVTPVGKPLAENETVAVNPFTGAMVMVLVAVPPWVTDTLVGAAESVKPGVDEALE